MFKLLAFLIILVILFGVETTRAFVFGTLGFLGWLIVALLVIAIISSIVQSYREKVGRAKREYLAAVIAISIGAAIFIYSALSSTATVEALFGAVMLSLVTYVVIMPSGDGAEPKKELKEAKKSPTLTWKGWLAIILIAAFLMSPLLLFIVK